MGHTPLTRSQDVSPRTVMSVTLVGFWLDGTPVVMSYKSKSDDQSTVYIYVLSRVVSR